MKRIQVIGRCRDADDQQDSDSRHFPGHIRQPPFGFIHAIVRKLGAGRAPPASIASEGPASALHGARPVVRSGCPYLDAFALMMIGVPWNTNLSRKRFSRNRSKAKWSGPGRSVNARNAGGAEPTWTSRRTREGRPAGVVARSKSTAWTNAANSPALTRFERASATVFTVASSLPSRCPFKAET